MEKLAKERQALTREEHLAALREAEDHASRVAQDKRLAAVKHVCDDERAAIKYMVKKRMSHQDIVDALNACHAVNMSVTEFETWYKDSDTFFERRGKWLVIFLICASALYLTIVWAQYESKHFQDSTPFDWSTGQIPGCQTDYCGQPLRICHQ